MSEDEIFGSSIESLDLMLKSVPGNGEVHTLSYRCDHSVLLGRAGEYNGTCLSCHLVKDIRHAYKIIPDMRVLFTRGKTMGETDIIEIHALYRKV